MIYQQMSIFDFLEKPTEKKDNSVAEFDKRFKVGDRFQTESGRYVLEITDIMLGEIMAQVMNVTLEEKKKYIGARYYINKTSYGKYYKEQG